MLSILITLRKPYYFDYASTTPVHPIVLDAMLPFFTEEFGNAGSSQHYYGWAADEAVEASRNTISSYFAVQPRQVIFTSGATESINLGILGFLKNKKPAHLITSIIEHKAVLEVFYALEVLGWSVTYLIPNEIGLIEVDSLIYSLQDNTQLVSLMMVNNETGGLTDFQAISKVCRKANVCFHSDATQALGKIDLSTCANLPDLISFSGHKIFGPKGIGALINGSNVILNALSFGGGQERGLRSGTLPVQQIVGLAACFKLLPDIVLASEQISNFKKRILQGFLGDYVLNSSDNYSVPHIISISIQQKDGEELYRNIPMLAVSNGSACNAKSQLPSHVLKALGHSDELAFSTIRISLSYMTKDSEVDYLIQYINSQVFDV